MERWKMPPCSQKARISSSAAGASFCGRTGASTGNTKERVLSTRHPALPLVEPGEDAENEGAQPGRGLVGDTDDVLDVGGLQRIGQAVIGHHGEPQHLDA